MKGNHGSYAAGTIGNFIVWRGATYDMTNGRTAKTPDELSSYLTYPVVPDGLVLGDRITVGGALFDPRSRDWIRIPDPAPIPGVPRSPGPAAAEFASSSCLTVGGPDSLARYCHLPTPRAGVPFYFGAVAVVPGQVEVLRVHEQ